MKVLSVAALSAIAAAVPAPRISLDLTSMGVAPLELTTPIVRAHDLGETQPDGAAVMSRQDYTMKCKADFDTAATCPLPTANAFDHIDQKVNVVERMFRIDLNGDDTEISADAVDYAERSTYLVKYDAEDAAGNHAEQVVFALILDDKTAPTISMCDGVAESVEAASEWWLCDSSTANDNVDDDVTASIRYTVQALGDSDSLTLLASSITKAQIAKDHADYQDMGEGASAVPAGGATGANVYLKDWTRHVGKYLVTLHANDDAGLYGRLDDAGIGQDNVAQARKAVNIKDTRAPWINVIGAEPAYWECASMEADHANHTYVDEGATATDLLDGQVVGGLTDNVNTTWGSLLPDTTVVADGGSANTIQYEATDVAGNRATTTRTVNVRDTLKPTVTLNGEAIVIYTAGSVFADEGVTCVDLCDGDRLANVTMSWNRAFPAEALDNTFVGAGGIDNQDVELGQFVRTYTCTDESNNRDYTTRRFDVQDTTDPVLAIQGQIEHTVCATRADEYVDQGATCEDFTEGSLSHAVEVSGDVVNMRIPGTYTIKYDCQDLSGNDATQQSRTVVVDGKCDGTCPRITVLGAELNYIEAGFPYVDAGATATDDLDGDITKLITTDGNTVDTAEVFYQRRSCEEIRTVFPQANTGEYYITTFDAATKQFARTLVWCYMDSTDNKGYTLYATEADTRVVPFTGASNADCESVGLEMLKLDSLSTPVKAAIRDKFDDGSSNLFFPQVGVETNMLICSTNDQDMDYSTKLQEATYSATPHAAAAAEKGKFVIEFHVVDSTGQSACEPAKRTVIVKDTLKSVEAMTIANFDQAQLNSRMSSYMAEESQAATSSGWVIGAAASAVTGLALLGFSQRKTIVTTVPV